MSKSDEVRPWWVQPLQPLSPPSPWRPSPIHRQGVIQESVVFHTHDDEREIQSTLAHSCLDTLITVGPEGVVDVGDRYVLLI